MDLLRFIKKKKSIDKSKQARIFGQRKSSRTKNREDKCKDRFLEEQLANTLRERLDLRAGKSSTLKNIRSLEGIREER